MKLSIVFVTVFFEREKFNSDPLRILRIRLNRVILKGPMKLCEDGWFG